MTEQLQAALQLLKSNMTISLGGGSHIQQLAQAIAASALTDLRICSPSLDTVAYCRQLGLPVDQTLTTTDIGFDGCDAADTDLRVLKSNGGIFTYEKRNALLTQRFVILAPQSRYAAALDPAVPLTVEVIDAAVPLVQAVAQNFGVTATTRTARTRDGNRLLDLRGADWRHITALHHATVELPGVLGDSLFIGLVSDLLLETATGTVTHIRKEVK